MQKKGSSSLAFVSCVEIIMQASWCRDGPLVRAVQGLSSGPKPTYDVWSSAGGSMRGEKRLGRLHEWKRNNSGVGGRGSFSARERKKQKRDGASKLGRASNRPGRRLGRWGVVGLGLCWLEQLLAAVGPVLGQFG